MKPLFVVEEKKEGVWKIDQIYSTIEQAEKWVQLNYPEGTTYRISKYVFGEVLQ